MKRVIGILLIGVLMVGCSTTGQKLKEKNNAAKLEVVSNIAYQQSKALTISNVPLAKVLNQNITTLVGQPTDTKKTNFVADIQLVKTGEYEANATLEQELAQTKDQLKEYKRWFGLHGVVLGFKQFGRDILYSTIGLTVLFVVLRIFASSSPIIAGIWNLFSAVFGWVINQFALMCPKLLDHIKDTEQEIVGTWKSLFGKIVGIFKKKNNSKTN